MERRLASCPVRWQPRRPCLRLMSTDLSDPGTERNASHDQQQDLPTSDRACLRVQAGAEDSHSRHPPRTTTRSASGDSCCLAKQRSCRTAWRARALLSWTTTSSRDAVSGVIATRDCKAGEGLPALLRVPEAVAQTGPRNGASIGRGTTVVVGGSISGPCGTRSASRARFGEFVPPLRVQRLASYLRDSLASSQHCSTTARLSRRGVGATPR
jgi:hypothetical protein